MYCPHCGHDTVIDASEYVPVDHDCLHCGAQFSGAEAPDRGEAEQRTA